MGILLREGFFTPRSRSGVRFFFTPCSWRCLPLRRIDFPRDPWYIELLGPLAQLVRAVDS